MGEWLRTTLWRQGHVLNPEVAKALGLVDRDSSAEFLVVMASHDCDLAQTPDVDPQYEMIVGRVIDEADGNYTWAKSPRRLHLPMTGGELSVVGDFHATEKRQVSKEQLADHAPLDKVKPSVGELTILQSWLAARYRRVAFPDEFERRMKEKPGNAFEKLTKILAPAQSSIVAIFFDLDRGKSVERSGAEDTYELTVILLHSAGDDPDASLKAANVAAKAIRELLRKVFLVDGVWKNVELRDVYVMSEDGMTVRQARLLRRWNLDHLSLRTEEQQPVLSN